MTPEFAFGDMDALAPREHSDASDQPGAQRRADRHTKSEASDPNYARAFNHLCHVLPLMKAGKVREVVDGLVMTVLVLEDVPLSTAGSVVGAVDGFFGIEIDEVAIQKSIDGHLAAGRLLRDPSSKQLIPSLGAKAEALKRVEDGRALEGSVRTEWSAELEVEGYSRKQSLELWDTLKAYMARAFRQHGAMAAQLLDPSLEVSAGDSANLAASLEAAIGDTCPSVEPDALRAAISGFFERPTAERTRYVAQLLDGTFSFFALTANEVTAVYVRGQLAPLKLFLDTNFIFGLLDLHENPLSDVSKELIELIKDQGFPFTLHYHERTLREIEHTLDSVASRLRSRRWSPEVSRAACKMHWVTGIERAYHRQNGESPVDVDVFLSKFEHIEDLLRDQGIRMYRTAQGHEPTVEQKGELIAEYLAYVEKHRPNRPPRPYEAADHDIVVWLELQHLRRRGKTALEVGALFLSADVLFSQFDWNKLRRGKDRVATVVLPGQFLQILRPFARTSDDFDRRFVQAFALPEFRSVHSDYAEVASGVLSYITMYKDMAEETAVRLLANDLLIRQLKGVEEGTPEFAELIESALANDNQVLIEEAEAAREEAERQRLERETALTEAEQQLGEKDAKILEITRKTEERVAAARVEEQQRADARIAEVADQEGQRRTEAETEASTLRDRLAEREAADAKRRRRGRWAFAAAVWVIASVLIVVVPHLVGWQWLLHHDHLPGIEGAAMLVVGGLLWRLAAPDHPKETLWVVAIGALIAIFTLI